MAGQGLCAHGLVYTSMGKALCNHRSCQVLRNEEEKRKKRKEKLTLFFFSGGKKEVQACFLLDSLVASLLAFICYRHHQLK